MEVLRRSMADPMELHGRSMKILWNFMADPPKLRGPSSLAVPQALPARSSHAVPRSAMEKIDDANYDPLTALTEITNFTGKLLAHNIRMGAKINEEEFTWIIKVLLQNEGEKQIQSKNPRIIANGEFLLKLNEDIEEIAKEYGWFSENLLWEV